MIGIGLAAAVVCYYLPWFTHRTAGFTMNAFDLAEWTSLHPAVRSSSPPMLTCFLLRLPQLVLAAAIGLAANRLSDPRIRWMVRALALLLVLRWIPPIDFFRGESGDPNYRQMAGLTGAGLVLIVAAIGLARLPERWQQAMMVGLLLLGVLAGWVGLSRAGILLDNFEIHVRVGVGIVGFSLASAVVILGNVKMPSLSRARE
jgi:hypothetical protein